MCRAHPGLLKLLKWPTGFYPLMLARVADQKHSVLRPEPCQEFAHLVRACQARFIHKIETLIFRCLAVGPAGQEPCNVSVSTPASASCRAAREVGAKPFTAYPR